MGFETSLSLDRHSRLGNSCVGRVDSTADSQAMQLPSLSASSAHAHQYGFDFVITNTGSGSAYNVGGRSTQMNRTSRRTFSIRHTALEGSTVQRHRTRRMPDNFVRVCRLSLIQEGRKMVFAIKPFTVTVTFEWKLPWAKNLSKECKTVEIDARQFSDIIPDWEKEKDSKNLEAISKHLKEIRNEIIKTTRYSDTRVETSINRREIRGRRRRLVKRGFRTGQWT